MKDESRYKESMMILSEIYGKQLNQLMLQLYWKILTPYSDEECELAFAEVIRNCKWWPKPADFIEILDGKKKDKAGMAWVLVVEGLRQVGNWTSVRFADPVIHSVLTVMGGWHKTGDWINAELTWKQREFDRLYAIMDRPDAKHPEYLPGLIEIQNAASGYNLIGAPICIGIRPTKAPPLIEYRGAA